MVSKEKYRSVMNDRLREALLEELIEDHDRISIEPLGSDGEEKGLFPRLPGKIPAKHKGESMFMIAPLREP